MRILSKIITLTGTGITIFVAIANITFTIIKLFDAGAALIPAVIAISLGFVYQMITIMLPLLAFIFVAIKRPGLNMWGYILAMISGGFSVITILFFEPELGSILGAATGFLTLIGGIMGASSVKLTKKL